MELNRVRRALPSLLGASVVVSIAVLGMAALLALAHRRGLSPDILLYNPAYRFHFWPYAGLPLHLGVFAMGAAGAICCFAASAAGKQRALLAAAGMFSLVLAADDFFMLHQQFWPKRGIPAAAVHAFYGALVLAGALAFRRELRGPGDAAIWGALLLLAGSLAVDRVGSASLAALVLEDTLKFAGFCLWSAFWIVRAHRAVSSAARNAA